MNMVENKCKLDHASVTQIKAYIVDTVGIFYGEFGQNRKALKDSAKAAKNSAKAANPLLSEVLKAQREKRVRSRRHSMYFDRIGWYSTSAAMRNKQKYTDRQRS